MKVLSFITASALVVATNAENTSLVYGRLARDAEVRGAKHTALKQRSSRVLKGKATSEANTSPRFVVPVAETSMSMSMSSPTRFIVPAEFSLSMPVDVPGAEAGEEDILSMPAASSSMPVDARVFSKGSKRRLQLSKDASATRTLKAEASMSMSMPVDFSLSMPATYMSVPAELSMSMPAVSMPAELSFSMPIAYIAAVELVGDVAEPAAEVVEPAAEEVRLFSKGSKRRLMLSKATSAASAVKKEAGISMSMSMPDLETAEFSLSTPTRFIAPAEFSFSLSMAGVEVAQDVAVLSKGSKRRLNAV